jgi:hypothetical protein
MAFVNMDAFKISMQQTKDNVKEFSRIAVNNAKAFQQTEGEYIKSSNQLRGPIERESQKK